MCVCMHVHMGYTYVHMFLSTLPSSIQCVLSQGPLPVLSSYRRD